MEGKRSLNIHRSMFGTCATKKSTLRSHSRQLQRRRSPTHYPVTNNPTRRTQRTVWGVSCCTVLLTTGTDTCQQMHIVCVCVCVCVYICICIYIYIYIYKQYFIYRKYPYMFRCICTIFKESHPSTLLKFHKSLRL